MTSEQLAHFLKHREEILSVKDKSNEFEGLELVKTPSQSPKPVKKTLSRKQQTATQGQGKLLLVALLENYCMLYDQSKEQNQKLFLILCQHLCRMGIIDNTDFLEEFSSVRSSYKKAFKELVLLAMKTVKESPIPLITDLQQDNGHLNIIRTTSAFSALAKRPYAHTIPLPIPNDFSDFIETSHPRFRQEFQILQLLGKGAFGKVLKTKNLLDSCHYAIKIIKTPSSGGKHMIRILREVKMMANISHTNIVRYYSSWMEHMEDVELASSEDESSDFESEDVTSETGESSIISANFSSSLSTKNLMLFIQMELCDSTLHVWLEQLNTFRHDVYRRIEEKILYCFSDLLNGVAFIHKKGYIHRDLKPKNIFWRPDAENQLGSTTNLGGRNGSWKIGDFGLATWTCTPFEESSMKQQQSLGVGTVTYASPEQLNPDFGDAYTEKTDIYSLGIILFELLVPMSTAMERAKLLSDLRKGVLPEDFMTARPKEAALILWMMSTSPSSRPTVADILELDWFTAKHSAPVDDNELLIAELKQKLLSAEQQIEHLTLENEKLREALAGSDSEI